ncbi:hypothetical protein Tco_1490881 [Tanacetum coccineum]
MGTMWCLCDPTPSNWCKTDAHSTNFVQIFYDHVNPATRRTIDQSAGGKLHDKNVEESWALIEDLSLYDNKSWNDPQDFTKPVKAISFPHDVSKASDRRLIKLENQVQRLMEAHLAPKPSVQVNKIASLCEIVDGLPMMPEDPYAFVVAAFQAPPLPDYVPGPEEPEQAPPSPEFVLEPVYPEFMPPEDEDDEEDPKEDPKEDLTNYHVDRGDDDNDDDESSNDDEDDDDDVEEKEEEDEEEHLASTPISLPSDTEVAKLLAIPTLPPSPLSPLSSPLPQILSPLPQILSLPLPISPPPLPTSLTYPLGYRADMIRLRGKSPSTSHSLPLPSPIVLPHTRASVAMMRANSPSTYILASRSETPPSRTPPLLPIPLPTPSPPLLLPSTDCRVGVSEVTLPPQMRLCIALGLRYEIRQDPEREDTDEIYGRLDDAQDDRLLMSGQLNMLRRDKRAYARTARLMETEARLFVRLSASTTDEDDRVAGSRPHPKCIAYGHTNTDEDTADICDSTPESKIAPKRTTRSTPATTTTLTTSVTDEKLKRLIDQGVANALAACNVERSRNGEDIDDSGMGVRRQAPPARECTYPDFLKCKPLYFKGTEGVIELTQWFERMGTMFRISNCSVENKIKFATCTLLRSALTWCRVLSLEDKAHLTGEDCNNSYFRLTLDRKNGLITFTDGIKEVTIKTPYRDPKMDDLTSEGHDLLSSRVILGVDDFKRGCKRTSDLESGFYKDVDNLGPSYSWKIERIDLDGPFEGKSNESNDGVT